MPDQSVSITAVLQDRFSGTLNTIQGGLASLAAAFPNLTKSADTVFTGISQQLDRLGTKIQGIQAGFAPLTNGVFEAVGGLVSFDLITKSLEEATQAKQAQAQLLVALDSDMGRFAAIQKTATDIATKSIYSVTQLTQASADLASRGVAYAELPRTLQITADLASRTGISLDQASRAIARIYNGQFPREVLNVAGGLQSIKKDSDRATEGLDILEKKLAGSAAAFAGTSIGKIQSAQNQLAQAYVRFGDILIEIEAKILPKVTEAFGKFIDMLSSPIGKQIVEEIGDIIASMTDAIPYAIAFAAALTTLRVAGLALGVIVPVIEGIGVALDLALSPVGLLIIGLAGLAAAVIYLSGGWDKLKIGFSGVSKLIQDIKKDLDDGSLTIKDLVNSAVAELKIFEINFKLYASDIPTTFLKGLQTYVEDVATAIELRVYALGTHIAAGFADAMGTVIHDIAVAVDKLTGSLADALSYVSSDLAGKVRTNIAGSSSSSGFSKTLTDAAKNADDAVALNKKNSPNFQRDVLDKVQAQRDQAADAVQSIDNQSLKTYNADHAKTGNSDQAKKDADKNARELAQIAAAGYAQEYQDILGNKSEALTKAYNQAELAKTKDLYEQRLITVQEYIQKKDELEQGSLQKELSGQEARLAQLQRDAAKEASDPASTTGTASANTQEAINRQAEQVQLTKLKITELTAKEVSQDQTLLGVDQQRTIELQKQLQISLLRAKGTISSNAEADAIEFSLTQQRKVDQLEKEHRSPKEVAQQQSANDLATATRERENLLKAAQQQAEAAKKALSSSFSGISDNLGDNSINPIEAEQQQEAALATYKQKFDAYIASIEQEVTAAKDAAADPEVIDALQVKLDEALTEEKHTLQQMHTEIQNISKGIGDALQGPFTSFFEKIASGTESVKNVFRDLLADITKQLLEFAASQAAKSLINALGGGEDGKGNNSGGLIPTLIGGVFGLLGTGLKAGLGAAFSGGGTAASSGDSDSLDANADDQSQAEAGASAAPAALATAASGAATAGLGGGSGGGAGAGGAIGLGGLLGVATGVGTLANSVGAVKNLFDSGSATNAENVTINAKNVNVSGQGGLDKVLSEISGVLGIIQQSGSLLRSLSGGFSGFEGIFGSLFQNSSADFTAAGVGDFASSAFASVGFNSGGILPGGGPDVDSRLVYLTPGEGILRRTAVQHYGESFVHAVNALTIPKDVTVRYRSPTPSQPSSPALNGGGIVPGQNQQPRVISAVVANDGESLRRLLNGNSQELADHMSQNPQVYRSALGIHG